MAAVLLVLVGLAFHHLTVEDEGDRLAVRFGPLAVLETSIHYADIKGIGVGRTAIPDGWGVHRSQGHGWLWNLWGRDCVMSHLGKGALRVGTDDPANLEAFLKQRIGLA